MASAVIMAQCEGGNDNLRHDDGVAGDGGSKNMVLSSSNQLANVSTTVELKVAHRR